MSWLALGIPIVAAVAIYAGALGNGFVWDDPLVLRQLDHMHGLRELLVPPDAVPKFYYRPLIFLTFIIDRRLAGDTAWQFHLTVLVWHVIVTALVFVAARRLLGAAHAIEAGLAALLFAVHPIHVESVAWIAGRSDVIATAFILLAVLCGAQRPAWTAWAAAAAVLLACWSKEVGLSALLLIPAWDAMVAGGFRWRRYVPLLLAVIFYFVSRSIGIGSVGGGLPSDAGAAENARNLLAAFAWYGWKLILPRDLNAYVPAVPAEPLYPIAGALLLAGMAAAAVWAWRNDRLVVTFLLLWWVVTLAPSLLVIVRRSASAVLAERYAYLPSVAAMILVAWGLARLRPASSPRWRAGCAVALALALVGAAHSMGRTRVWADNLSFWTDVVAKVPGDPLPHRELADAYMARNQLVEAEKLYQYALSLDSNREGRVMTLNNLGNLYVRREQYDQAEAAFRQGLELFPHPNLYSGLGRTAIERARRSRDQVEAVRYLHVARDSLAQAVVRDPQDYKSHNMLGQVLLNLGEPAAAREHFEASLRIQPTGAIADVARDFLRRLDR
jgi:tetratricopeptide (TPR) repeat protein